MDLNKAREELRQLYQREAELKAQWEAVKAEHADLLEALQIARGHVKAVEDKLRNETLPTLYVRNPALGKSLGDDLYFGVRETVSVEINDYDEAANWALHNAPFLMELDVQRFIAGVKQGVLPPVANQFTTIVKSLTGTISPKLKISLSEKE